MATASPNLTLKQYDTYPPLTAVLTDSNGPVQLSGATQVHIALKGQNQGGIIYGACTIASAAGGFVQYAWGVSDTSQPDTYLGEFRVDWAAGGEQKFPNQASQNFVVEIDAALDGSTA